jgi:hypothetical protein
MIRTLPGMSLRAAMLFARPSVAAGGVNLAWNNCASEGGTVNLTSACDSNTGFSTLTGSFVPDADIAGVTGIECVLYVIVGDGTSAIPPWWELAGLGDCRSGSLSANAVVSPPNTVCTDWAGGTTVEGGLAAYTGGGYHINPANQPAVRMMVLGFAVPPAGAADLVSTQEYFAFNVRIGNASTLGTPSCGGCTAPACIVLNSINVATPDIGVRQFLSTGTFAGSNFATWQGVGPSCQLVPTKKATWGQVKSLYH